MRFLADESCDFAVIHALRGEGYDVLSVSEIKPRAGRSTRGRDKEGDTIWTK